MPLPEDLYRRLRTEAERTRRPATEVAREAIDRWVTEAERVALHADLAAYAARAAGSPDDLDVDVEAAAVEQLLDAEPKRKPPARKRRS